MELSGTGSGGGGNGLIGLISGGVLLAATVAAIAVVVAGSGGDGDGSVSRGPFGPHYGGLEERRLAADVPTMSDASAGGPHIHPRLEAYVRGEQITVPPNIGIDPSAPPQDMAGLHTHDPDGTIHVENASDPTLGQFFEIWGVALSAEQLGPHMAKGKERVRIWVDGQPSQAFGDLVMEDEQEIVVAYGSGTELPPGLRP